MSLHRPEEQVFVLEVVVVGYVLKQSRLLHPRTKQHCLVNVCSESCKANTRFSAETNDHVPTLRNQPAHSVAAHKAILVHAQAMLPLAIQRLLHAGRDLNQIVRLRNSQNTVWEYSVEKQCSTSALADAPPTVEPFAEEVFKSRNDWNFGCGAPTPFKADRGEIPDIQGGFLLGSAIYYQITLNNARKFAYLRDYLSFLQSKATCMLLINCIERLGADCGCVLCNLCSPNAARLTFVLHLCGLCSQ